MPKPPDSNSYLNKLKGSPYSKFAEQIKSMGDPKYPLHIGDTYLEPTIGARMEDLNVQRYPGMHRYTKTKGLPQLIRALSNEYAVEEGRLVITPGATGGLFLVAKTFLEVGEEVLILAPYWPLAAGIVQNVGAVPVDVPFYDSTSSVEELLSPYLSNKTVALYVNTPNNPTGLMLGKERAKELAVFAEKHNLWIWSDDVYEKLIFEGEHISMRSYAPSRTFSVYSFSKVYGMAGNRCGYVIGPNSDLVSALQKTIVNSIYSVSTASQLAALKALEHGEEWLQNAKEAYRSIAYETADILDLPRPSGGTFLFWDVKPELEGRSMDEFFLECIAAKLLIAPGSSFGSPYSSYVRFCYTCSEPEIVREGALVLRKILRGS